jgi:ArsR family transcriptional regulator
MNIEILETKIYKALAHPVRLELVKKLAEGERCVCDLFDESEFTQPNISQHLRVLKDADILTSERKANKLIYSIKHNEIMDIMKLARAMVRAEINNLMEGK